MVNLMMHYPGIDGWDIIFDVVLICLTLITFRGGKHFIQNPQLCQYYPLQLGTTIGKVNQDTKGPRWPLPEIGYKPLVL